MNEEATYNRTEEEVERRPRRRLLTPFTCCLGCGGFILLVLIALGVGIYWAYNQLVVDTPLDIQMPAVAGEVRTAAEEKIQRLEGKAAAEVTLTENEVNALLQKQLEKLAKAHEADPSRYKGRIDLKEGGKGTVLLSVPFKDTEQYINLQYEGKVRIADGELDLSDIEQAKIGKLNLGNNIMLFLDKLLDRVKALKEEGKKAPDLTGRIQELTIQEGQVKVKLKGTGPAEDKPGNKGGK